MGASSGLQASGLAHHVSQGVTQQVIAHVGADVGPHPEEDALTFVVTGPIAVRLAKVTGHNGPVHGGDNFGQGDVVGVAGQDVPTANTSLGTYEADALQDQENLLEIRLGETRSRSQISHRSGREGGFVERERQQRATGVITASGNLHVKKPTRNGYLGDVSRLAISGTLTGMDSEFSENVTVGPDEVFSPSAEQSGSTDVEGESDFISQPAKVMRIGSMVKTLLDEARSAPLDEAGRVRLAEIYATSLRELSGALSPDLQSELSRMAGPFTSPVPTESELRIAQAQLVGWLEGLFHGIQASLFAQQAAAAAQLEKMRDRSLSSGNASDARPGTYL